MAKHLVTCEAKVVHEETPTAGPAAKDSIADFDSVVATEHSTLIAVALTLIGVLADPSHWAAETKENLTTVFSNFAFSS